MTKTTKARIMLVTGLGLLGYSAIRDIKRRRNKNLKGATASLTLKEALDKLDAALKEWDRQLERDRKISKMYDFEDYKRFNRSDFKR